MASDPNSIASSILISSLYLLSSIPNAAYDPEPKVPYDMFLLCESGDILIKLTPLIGSIPPKISAD
ncbi:hypothetical protein A0H76_1899 [Hepatospora eriocheir]|uniref:Uncharacterized protein n=1 Tax=Hepatospora eriocheir TaxID=1081669 RepID=A0A1X0QKG9_9MICR|nr:hypothetical protein A0H76_1899 [Hepatospora eriocheir]